MNGAPSDGFELMHCFSIEGFSKLPFCMVLYLSILLKNNCFHLSYFSMDRTCLVQCFSTMEAPCLATSQCLFSLCCIASVSPKQLSHANNDIQHRPNYVWRRITMRDRHISWQSPRELWSMFYWKGEGKNSGHITQTYCYSSQLSLQQMRMRLYQL